MKPSGNSDLRIIRKDTGSFSSIEISNHFSLTADEDPNMSKSKNMR
jgi:hypothetical protein